MLLRLTIPGCPIPKGRPRFSRTKDGDVVTYTPEQTREHEKRIRQLARLAWGGREPVAGPLRMVFRFYVPDRRTRDDDNLVKTPTDAMNKVVFFDDRQRKDLDAKVFIDADNPRTELTVELGSPELVAMWGADFGRPERKPRKRKGKPTPKARAVGRPVTSVGRKPLKLSPAYVAPPG